MELCGHVVRWCLAHQVREVVLCAGARNLALVSTWCAIPGVRRWNFPEERSAAFFALGRARATGKPVAVVVTSGTAVAELLPAAIEAYYQGLPLVLITADRPSRFRGTGAPQSIDQVGLFGNHAVAIVDAEAGGLWQPTAWDQSGPAHLNVCFDEPVLDAPVAMEECLGENPAPTHLNPPAPYVWDDFGAFGNLLVMVGSLDAQDQPDVLAFLLKIRAPMWIQADSGLWGRPELEDFVVRQPELLLNSGLSHVLRLGGVPCARIWRDLESRPDIQVRSISRQGWSGLGRNCENWKIPLDALAGWQPEDYSRKSSHPTDQVLLHAAQAPSVAAMPSNVPCSEEAWFTWLSSHIPDQATVFLGNSLPIREWQSAATWRAGLEIFANRGANGIDGEISTFLGLAESAVGEAWGIFGDLTTVYDLAAPWVITQMRGLPVRIVIINNGGGKIFAALPSMAKARPDVRTIIQNGHALGFAGWAQLWELPYRIVTSPDDLCHLPPHPIVLEIVPKNSDG